METILKSLLVWMCILPFTFLIGTIQAFIIEPITGYTTALNICSLALMCCTYLMTYFMLPRIESQPQNIYYQIGLTWILASLIFDFSMRFITNIPSDIILGNYNIFEGRIWILLFVFMGITPILVAKHRGLTYKIN